MLLSRARDDSERKFAHGEVLPLWAGEGIAVGRGFCFHAKAVADLRLGIDACSPFGTPARASREDAPTSPPSTA